MGGAHGIAKHDRRNVLRKAILAVEGAPGALASAARSCCRLARPRALPPPQTGPAASLARFLGPGRLAPRGPFALHQGSGLAGSGGVRGRVGFATGCVHGMSRLASLEWVIASPPCNMARQGAKLEVQSASVLAQRRRLGCCFPSRSACPWRLRQARVTAATWRLYSVFIESSINK